MATVQKNLLKFALVVSPTTKKGFKFNDSSAAVVISTATNASPIAVTTATNHGYVTGQQVYITGVATNTAANNTSTNPSWTITRTGATTFTLDGSTGNGAGTGGTATAELIGTVDPASMPRQRLLDIYNMARFALFQVLQSQMDKMTLGKECGALATSATVDFGTAAVMTDATKPTGYIDFISLATSADVQIIMPREYAGMTQQELINEVRSGDNLDFTQSATNMHVFDIGSTLATFGTVGVNSGNSYVTGSAVKLVYYGITEFTLTDVLGNSTTETYNEKYHQLLIEVASMIYLEFGEQDIANYILKFLGK